MIMKIEDQGLRAFSHELRQIRVTMVAFYPKWFMPQEVFPSSNERRRSDV